MSGPRGRPTAADKHAELQCRAAVPRTRLARPAASTPAPAAPPASARPRTSASSALRLWQAASEALRSPRVPDSQARSLRLLGVSGGGWQGSEGRAMQDGSEDDTGDGGTLERLHPFLHAPTEARAQPPPAAPHPAPPPGPEPLVLRLQRLHLAQRVRQQLQGGGRQAGRQAGGRSGRPAGKADGCGDERGWVARRDGRAMTSPSQRHRNQPARTQRTWFCSSSVRRPEGRAALVPVTGATWASQVQGGGGGQPPWPAAPSLPCGGGGGLSGGSAQQAAKE